MKLIANPEDIVVYEDDRWAFVHEDVQGEVVVKIIPFLSNEWHDFLDKHND